MHDKYPDRSLVTVLKYFLTNTMYHNEGWTIHFKQNILTLMYQQIINLSNKLTYEQIPTYKQLNRKIDNHCSKS